MSVTVPISQRVGRLPLNYEFTPAGYRPLLLQRLELYLSGANVILGTSDAAIPARNVGPWFDPSTRSMWIWNDNNAQYEPIEIGLISGNFGITINAAPTAARTLTLPDATGTALLLQDVAIPKETVILTSTGGTVSTIDADVSNTFILTLTENSTIPSLTNMAVGSGKRIRIAIINDGTSFTVTWPSAGANVIKWPTGPSHTQPAASAGRPKALAIYTISEADLGIVPHLWGDPEVSGFGGSDTIDTGGANSPKVTDAYRDANFPPTKGRRPYNIP